MQLTRTILNVMFAYVISTPLTNFGRAKDSNKNSNDNQKNVQAFQVSKGWSPQFPMVVVSMKDWPCEAGPDFPNGCTAQAYIDGEMTRRQKVWDGLKADKLKADTSKEDKNDVTTELQAFEDVFTSNGKLIELTIDNSYWVHSGHQRTEFVFMPAYVEFLRRKASGDPKADEYHTTVPALVGTYTSLLDLLEDQVAINSSASNQNKLTVLDYTKAAVRAIGTKERRIDESEFRRWGSEKKAKDGKTSNSGAYPRWGYLLADLNYSFKQQPGFYNALVQPPTVVRDGETEAVDNEKYIDYREVALSHDDPRCDVAVISRLIEPTLSKLFAYDQKYGSGNELVIKGDKENPVSAPEQDVLNRSRTAGKPLPWTEEEFKAWMDTKKHGPSYKHPVVTKPEVAYKPETAKAVMNTHAMPLAVRDYLSEHVFGNKTGAGEKLMDRQEAIDFVYSLDQSNEQDVVILEALKVLFTFREGDTKGYSAFVQAFKKLADKSLPKAPVEETTATPASSG